MLDRNTFERQESLVGLYAGVVESVQDPEMLGRLKIRVPHVYGPTGAEGSIDLSDLPWAFPSGLPAGGAESGGMSWMPAVGDQVYVQFLDGEPEKPVWTWGNQTRDQRKKLKLHQYDGAALARALLTRYGHALEFKADQAVLTTQEGYQLLLQGSASAAGGAATLQTPKGQYVRLNDARESVVVQGLKSAVMSAATVILNSASGTLIKAMRFTLMAGSSMLTFQGKAMTITTETGATVVIDDAGNVSLNSSGSSTLSLENQAVQLGNGLGTGMVMRGSKVSVNSPQIVFNTSAFSVGTLAGYPVVLMTPAMITWLEMMSVHTHGAPMGTTTPPLEPMVAPLDAFSLRMQTS